MGRKSCKIYTANPNPMKTIAVLLTCHNRRLKTIPCLRALFDCQLPYDHSIEVFLVDDGSSDGTANAVRENFPMVRIIQGNGNLFWNKGMRLAWETACQVKNYDYYLWLNDDTILDKKAILFLIEACEEGIIKDNKPPVLCGACRAKDNSNTFSYGGRNEFGPIHPNGDIQKCKYINGNVVLVPRDVYNAIGNLALEYTHVLGDRDYGLRVLKENFKCYTTKTYIATCPPNLGLPAWCNPNTSLKMRWKLLHSPKGLNIKEYIIYCKKFYGWKWIFFTVKAYMKTISPTIYKAITNKN